MARRKFAAVRSKGGKLIGTFNVEYLMDVLKVYKAAGCDAVKLSQKQDAANRPLVFNGPKIKALLMPRCE